MRSPRPRWRSRRCGIESVTRIANVPRSCCPNGSAGARPGGKDATASLLAGDDRPGEQARGGVLACQAELQRFRFGQQERGTFAIRVTLSIPQRLDRHLGLGERVSRLLVFGVPGPPRPRRARRPAFRGPRNRAAPGRLSSGLRTGPVRADPARSPASLAECAPTAHLAGQPREAFAAVCCGAKVRGTRPARSAAARPSSASRRFVPSTSAPSAARSRPSTESCNSPPRARGPRLRASRSSSAGSRPGVDSIDSSGSRCRTRSAASEAVPRSRSRTPDKRYQFSWAWASSAAACQPPPPSRSPLARLPSASSTSRAGRASPSRRPPRPPAPRAARHVVGEQPQPRVAQFGLRRLRPARDLGLRAERLELAADLAGEVGQPGQVGLHRLELAQRLLLAPAVLEDAGGLLDEAAALLGRRRAAPRRAGPARR